MKKLIFLLLCGISIPAAMAQDGVRKADIMYQKTIVRALDLRERQNLPLFSKNREITSLLINAVLRGDLVPYASDSLTTRLTIEEFRKKLILPSSSVTEIDTTELMITDPDDWMDILANPPAPEYYLGKDLYQLEIRERVLFDKERSKMYYDIESITLYVPADHPENVRGIQDHVATFRFKEVSEKVFKNNPNAIAFNPQNDAQHKNLADAFELRLFSSYIVKVSNAKDEYLTDIYHDQHMGIMASQWASQELLEYEHHLWEF